MIHFEPKRILCAVDLSPASSAVLSWARLLAEAFAARVEVLYANWSEPPRYFTEGQLQTFAAEADASRQKLQQDLDCLARRVLGPGLAYETRVEDGHAVEVILANIESRQPDLILLGSHGHSGAARLLMGSVAENVVRQAQCPVLVVKGPEVSHERTRLQHVV